MNGSIQAWEGNVRFSKQGRDPLALTFLAGGEEMLRVARDGFYVRGELVPQDAQEAKRVHAVFLKWLRSMGMAV